MLEGPSDLVKGTFQDLGMIFTIAVMEDDVEPFLALFDWSGTEDKELCRLANKGMPNNENYKKLKHLLELFNLAYTLSMNPSRDMSGEMPCSWQLYSP